MTGEEIEKGPATAETPSPTPDLETLAPEHLARKVESLRHTVQALAARLLPVERERDEALALFKEQSERTQQGFAERDSALSNLTKVTALFRAAQDRATQAEARLAEALWEPDTEDIERALAAFLDVKDFSRYRYSTNINLAGSFSDWRERMRKAIEAARITQPQERP